MTTTPQQLPRQGADPVAHTVAAVPIPQTIFLVLFCLFIVIFIRITHFTLSQTHEYAITRSLGCHHGREHGPSSSYSSSPNREMTASLVPIGFNTVTSPQSSLHILVPNLIFGNNTHENRISAPLLLRQEPEGQIESVEMDSVAVKAEEDWEDYSPLHGTNNLNTPWSWTA